MALELMYTSVPKGLKPGTSGFCTVAATSGMPDPMVQRLESLSGYRPIYRVGSRDADKNPPIYAHWRAKIGGRYHSILSYVCFAGADHTQRSNKFAHHVVVKLEEQVSCGPASVMMHPGLLKKGWSGEPRILPPTKTIRDRPNPLRKCKAWEEATGDAGWAGVFAEAFLLDATKPAYIIYEPGMDPLPLIDEAIALLAIERRWRVTFNTHFSTLPPGLNCSWRCCVAGTDAAAEAPSQATGGVLVDLTRPVGHARDSSYTEMARTGTGSIGTGERDSGDEMISASTVQLVPQVGRTVSRASQGTHAIRPADAHGDANAGSTIRESGARGRGADDMPPRQRRGYGFILWFLGLTWPVLAIACMWLTYTNMQTRYRLRDHPTSDADESSLTGSGAKGSKEDTADDGATHQRDTRGHANKDLTAKPDLGGNTPSPSETDNRKIPEQPVLPPAKPQDAGEDDATVPANTAEGASDAKHPSPASGFEKREISITKIALDRYAAEIPKLDIDLVSQVVTAVEFVLLETDATDITLAPPKELDSEKFVFERQRAGQIVFKSGSDSTEVYGDAILEDGQLKWRWFRFDNPGNPKRLENTVRQSVLSIEDPNRGRIRFQLTEPEKAEFVLSKKEYALKQDCSGCDLELEIGSVQPTDFVCDKIKDKKKKSGPKGIRFRSKRDGDKAEFEVTVECKSGKIVIRSNWQEQVDALAVQRQKKEDERKAKINNCNVESYLNKVIKRIDAKSENEKLKDLTELFDTRLYEIGDGGLSIDEAKDARHKTQKVLKDFIKELPEEIWLVPTDEGDEKKEDKEYTKLLNEVKKAYDVENNALQGICRKLREVENKLKDLESVPSSGISVHLIDTRTKAILAIIKLAD